MLVWIWAMVGCAPVPVEPTGQPFDVAPPGPPTASETRALGAVGPAPVEPAGSMPGSLGLTQLPPIPVAPTDAELAQFDAPPPLPPEMPAPMPLGEPTISPTAIDLNWDPAMPTRDEAFGVRLIGTMIDAQPPNAVLQLPSGQKVLVEAGEMLNEPGLLVLAVGDRVVKVVQVTKQGWYARVETAVLHSNPRASFAAPVPAPPPPASNPTPPAP